MLANWITLSRLPVLLLCILSLYLGSAAVQLGGVGLLFVGFMLDTVDGVVARRSGRTSVFGSVLDIAADRTYELVLWVCFADLRMVPMALPLIVVARTALTDALRSIEVGRGIAPFTQHQSRPGRFLVASPWMRIGYSVGKITTFCGLALARALSGFPGATTDGGREAMLTGLTVSAWLTVMLCVARGLPVIVGSLRRHLASGGHLAPAEAGLRAPRVQRLAGAATRDR
jgi:phosphatidylglycerophosphate synthase